MIENNMTPEEEAKANAFGDKLAKDVLGLKADLMAPHDSQGNTRWALPGGSKTGLGLLRTLEHFFDEQAETIGEKA